MTERYPQWVVVATASLEEGADSPNYQATDCYTVQELEAAVGRLEAEDRTFTVFPLGVRP